MPPNSQIEMEKNSSMDRIEIIAIVHIMDNGQWLNQMDKWAPRNVIQRKYTWIIH